MDRVNIAVIDDDQNILEAFEEILKGEGFSVVCFSNGRKALKALVESKAPDMIICDLVMPEMNGWEFLEAWTLGNKNHDSIPIVVVSATPDYGIFDYKPVREVIRKPFELDALLCLANKYCKKAEVA